MSALSRSIRRLSKRRKKQRDLPAIIEQDQPPTTPTELFPTHLEVPNTSKPSFLGRGMDRIRRSIRQSFRRNRSQERHPPTLVNMPEGTGRSDAWQPDDAAVRAGVCSFSVKYLGAIEVYESRGMPVCEGALKHLRSMKRHPVKAILYVSGDGLRVVDQENSRGLMVDQTIEKVSFCAPDRNNDKGFAYICRDGTSRRWMCHGFHASKDTGERLSHAVGCAFGICLEKKKKRDEDTIFSEKPISAEKALNPDWGDKIADGSSTASPANNGHSMQRTNNAYQSFRKQIPISDRLQDPQSAIMSEIPSCSIHQTLPCIAKPRPAANPALFQRQGSLRAPETSQSAQFRRNFSLRTPATESPKRNFGTVLNNEPIYEGDEDNLVSFAPMQYSSSATPASTSYSTTPSKTMTSSFSGFADFPSPSHVPGSNGYAQIVKPSPAASQPQQPDLMNFNDLMDFNKPISISTQQFSPPSAPAVPSNVSKADDWLNNTLKTSFSFGSPVEMTPSPSMGSIETNGMTTNSNQYYANVPGVPANGFMSNAQPQLQTSINQNIAQRNGPPPTMAPPPIPQRPPGVASVIQNGQMKGAVDPRTNGTAGTDAFGQSINWESTSPQHVPRPEDPFDIQWSKMAISANNPFASDQQRIST